MSFAGIALDAAPTLILHGSADPLLPWDHAQALHDRIAGSRLVALEEVGHELPPPPMWDLLVAEVVRHTGHHRAQEKPVEDVRRSGQ